MFSLPRLASLMLIVCLIAANAPALAGNDLADHPSPYLALHGDDPVHWQSWHPRVFEEARLHNRLVFVSVGYFSCHWCHVMQRQSYQHEATASFLNGNYLSVKIDRELEPDLDRRLIDFVREVRGVAGWPLNVFLTPEGYPLTGFTYLPQPEFLRVLEQLQQQWQQRHGEMAAMARSFAEARAHNQDFDQGLEVPAERLLDGFVAQTLQAADELQGGFGNTSKFPQVPQLEALLQSLALAPERADEIAEFLQLTLDSMARYNLFDHVNGGFFRYTTDPDWHTPHYEKMLYDNALLADLYLQAAERWPDRGYERVAVAALDFVESGLRHSEGGYLSSLSAVDRAEREGGAYLWTPAQLETLLGENQTRHLQQTWRLSPVGDAYLLHPPNATDPAAQSETDLEILRQLRDHARREMPADDKRLAGWNALMLTALTRAASSHEQFAEQARNQYRFMRANFYRDGGLLRVAGNADIADAAFEDYALFAHAMQRYGEFFDDASAIRLAESLTVEAHRLFFRDGYWQTHDGAPIAILQGRIAIEDQVLPSPLARWLVTARNLPELDPKVADSAARQLSVATRDMLDSPFYHGSQILLRAHRDD